MVGKKTSGVNLNIFSVQGHANITYQRIYAEECFASDMIEYIEKSRKFAGKQDMITKESDLYDYIREQVKKYY